MAYPPQKINTRKKYVLYYWLWIGLSCTLLSSCVHYNIFPINKKNSVVSLGNNAYYRLLPASSSVFYGTLIQELIYHTPKQTQHFICQTEISPTAIRFVLLSPIGMTLLTLQYQNNTFTYQDNSAITQYINPSLLLADIQLALWPVSALRTQITNAQIDTQTKYPSLQYRNIMQGKHVLLRITINNNTPLSHITLNKEHYHLEIRMIETIPAALIHPEKN